MQPFLALNWAPWLVGLAVFGACLMGIHTRQANFLAALWPANAVMLGLLLRVPGAARPLGWFAAVVGFLAADLLSGSGVLKTLVLNGTNLLGVGVAFAVMRRLSPGPVRLAQPIELIHLMLAAATAGAVAGIAGGFINLWLFHGGVVRGWVFWFASEFVNYVLILPVLLILPSWPSWRLRRWRSALARIGTGDLWPVVALVASCAVALLLGGQGALAFPVPALLWCSLSYRVLPTASLSMLFGCWSLFFLSEGLAAALEQQDELLVVSLRLGVSLVAVTPLLMACMMQSRNDLLNRLQHLAMHDRLTGLCNRVAFEEQALGVLRRDDLLVGMLMLDLDHFKRINDAHGHVAGDVVLVGVAQRIQQCLRAGDLLCRFGGEEFAVLITSGSAEAMKAVGQRICDHVAGAPIDLPGREAVYVTLSIGLAIADQGWAHSWQQLLAEADVALYEAKRAGRNQLVWRMATPAA